jgi:hypothetical protein
MGWGEVVTVTVAVGFDESAGADCTGAGMATGGATTSTGTETGLTGQFEKTVVVVVPPR